MIRHISFTRFRGFERLSAILVPHAYIVGPNSAGKSTILEAVAFAELCLQRARRLRSNSTAFHDGQQRYTYSLPPSLEDEEDPVRYDFGSHETRVRLKWVDGSVITIVWPEESDDDQGLQDKNGYFYLEASGGAQVFSVQSAKKHFPAETIVVPVVTPLDRVEDIKNVKYIEARARTRLASRHFRNHVAEMESKGQWEQFKLFASQWAPELSLLDVTTDYASNRLSVFYTEGMSRVPKELAWAGDGLQIWIQLLWHLFRANGAKTIVLDEPDVYLHPDLQRRLVRILDNLGSQILLASHSADIASEAPAEGVLWVDRRTNMAKRAGSRASLSSLSESLGSSFNIALARAMRAKMVVATDCDTRLLKKVAASIGAMHVASEQGLQLLQLAGGVELATYASAKTQIDNLASNKLPTTLLLEGAMIGRDVFAERAARDFGVSPTSLLMLNRRKLLNYLLDASTIARISGSSGDTVELKIAESIELQYEAVRTDFILSHLRNSGLNSNGEDLNAAEDKFESLWSDKAERLKLVSGYVVLDSINIWLHSEGYDEVSPEKLATKIGAEKLDAEIYTTLFALERSVELLS